MPVFHNMVICTESAGAHREIPLRAFHNTLGHVTDRTSSEAIAKAADTHGVESTICRWIFSMLESRNITAMLLGETLQGSATRKCPEKGTVTSAVEPAGEHIFLGIQQGLLLLCSGMYR
jgi:hypothetical protein